jgi:hypothetical protein
MIRLFTLMSLAMVDTVAPTYNDQVHLPATGGHTTAIQEGESDGNPNTPGDPTWTSRAQSVGGTPEYWSGHSTFSAAGGAGAGGVLLPGRHRLQLRQRLGAGGTPRSYTSFSAAVDGRWPLADRGRAALRVSATMTPWPPGRAIARGDRGRQAAAPQRGPRTSDRVPLWSRVSITPG